MHYRADIRHYVRDLLKEGVDVGGRVYACRPYPVLRGEFECVFVYFASEKNRIIEGQQYVPKTYERTLTLSVDIWVPEKVDPTSGPFENSEAEDRADELGQRVEYLLSQDFRLAKRLDDYNPDLNYGLSVGISLEETQPYIVDGDAEYRILAQSIKFNVPYHTQATSDKRPKPFEYYQADQVDPADGVVLLSTEGKINE
jgi:hypothetical protein